jgi:hypothetical protein
MSKSDNITNTFPLQVALPLSLDGSLHSPFTFSCCRSYTIDVNGNTNKKKSTETNQNTRKWQ